MYDGEAPLFDANSFANFITDSYGDRPATKLEVEKLVSSWLDSPVGQQFRDAADEIVNEVLRRVTVSVEEAATLVADNGHQEWLSNADRSEWKRWGLMRRYLNDRKGFPKGVLAELDRSTDRTLGLIESPTRQGRWDRRGMVVGHVQSGKTTHYASLVCKALDAGYRAVIVLSGIHDNLRSQTQARLDEYVIGRQSDAAVLSLTGADSGRGAAYGIGALAGARGIQDALRTYDIQSVTHSGRNGDFRADRAQSVWINLGDQSRLVMVTKKNAAVLRKLKKWVKRLFSEEQGGIDHPTLIIDDEADHASINTRGADDPTAINRLIRELVCSFNRVAYVSYTATPFANVFIDHEAVHESDEVGQDLFPSGFIVSLRAPSNYVGPDKVFGHDGDELQGIEQRQPLPVHVSVKDAAPWLPMKHKISHVPGPMPESLEEAVRCFALVCAARRVRQSQHNGKSDALKIHNSMLVHATRFNPVQKKVADQLRTFLRIRQQLLESGGRSDYLDEEQKFRDVWQRRFVGEHGGFVDALGKECPELLDWSELRPELTQAVLDIDVREIHGKSDDSLAYENSSTGISVIAVGGDKLSRGLTLEGLSVSYFLRGSRMFDTLMQMGRWFGYRDRYVDLCRVFTTDEVFDAFREISLATEELRADFDRMAASHMEPKDFGLRVRRPTCRELMITAANKIRAGTDVTVTFSGQLEQALLVPLAGDAADTNRQAFVALIAGLPVPEVPVSTDGRQYVASRLWRAVPGMQVVKFLERFVAYRSLAFTAADSSTGGSAICQYVRDRMAAGELDKWSVCLVTKRAGGTRQLVVGGKEFACVERGGVVSADGRRFHMKSLSGSADEFVDLSDDIFDEVTSYDGDQRRFSRSKRDARNGLLLLYAIQPKKVVRDEDGKVIPEESEEKYLGDQYVVACAVAFPESARGGGAVSYKANTVMVRELESWADDVEDEDADIVS